MGGTPDWPLTDDASADGQATADGEQGWVGVASASFTLSPNGMRIETVVVGLDFTEPSADAVAWTARHFAPEARLLIIHCIRVPEPPRFIQGRFPPPEELVASARRGADDRLRETIGKLDLERAEVIVREGEPADQIEALAAERGADVVVVGPHHDRTGVWRLIGGTAQRIARRSSVPVLVARGLQEHAPSHILVPVDDSELTEPVLRWASALARRYDSRVTAVHVVGDSLMGAIRIGGTETEIRDASTSLLESADVWLRERLEAAKAPSEDVQRRILVGDAAHEILSLAQGEGADLIVMGRSGTGRIGELILGSVANSVLRNGSGPLLLVGNERG